MSDPIYQTAFTAENLKALEEAIASGVQRVKYSDKEIWYQSLSDMLQVRKLMRAALGLDNSVKTGMFGGKRLKAVHSKGLNECD